MPAKVKTQTGFLKFTYGGATARLTLWDDRTATVSGVYSRRRGNGEAKEVLETICAYADDHGLDLDLDVNAYGDDNGLPNGALVKFYYKFQFEVTPFDGFPVQMVRHHR